MRRICWFAMTSALALGAAAWPAARAQAPGTGYLSYDASRPQGWAVRE